MSSRQKNNIHLILHQVKFTWEMLRMHIEWDLSEAHTLPGNASNWHFSIINSQARELFIGWSIACTDKHCNSWILTYQVMLVCGQWSSSYFISFLRHHLPLLHLAFKKSWVETKEEQKSFEEPWLSFIWTILAHAKTQVRFVIFAEGQQITKEQISMGSLTNYIPHSRSERLSCLPPFPAFHFFCGVFVWQPDWCQCHWWLSSDHQRIWQMSFSWTQLNKGS